MGRVSIIGLGLIGSSLGLAIQRAKPANTEIIGFDRDSDVAAAAKRLGTVNTIVPTLERAVSEANLIIVATPIVNTRKVFEEMGPYLRPGTVVTDTASTKADVLRWARDALPAGVHFVGGHPMAGKEHSGPAAAAANLFDEKPYCIVPGVDASPGAVSAVVGMAVALGARTFFLDAEEHDAYAAAISHVPLVASLALFQLAKQSAAWPELASMSGPAFRDLTRLASGQPEMAHDIFLTNRENVLHWLDRYVTQLGDLAELIRSDEGETLFKTLAQTQFDRDNYLENPPQHKQDLPDARLPSTTESFMSMLGGALWTNRAREITESMEERLKQREMEDRLRRRE